MTVVTCPRCDVDVVMHEGYGVCTGCDTTWLHDERGELVAR